jgi:hypothetical protein
MLARGAMMLARAGRFPGVVVVVVTTVVTLITLTGCGAPGDELAGVKAVSGDLSGWKEVEVAVIGGFVAADATLTFTDEAGAGHSVPVGVGGPVVGFIFEFHDIEEDSFFEGSGGASLNIPDGGVDVPDLFKPYNGSGGGAGLAFGGSTHELKNDAGVGIDAGGLGIAMGMIVDLEWFSIDPKEELK